MSSSKASDLDLITDLRAGKHEALTEIFRRHWKPLYLTAFYKLRSHALAEEIVQDLFTELWDTRERLFNNPEKAVKLDAYLSTAVRNKVLNHMRKLVYDQKYWEWCRSHLAVSENTTHELAEYNELEERLNAAVDQLSEKTREIFVLHKLKGVPVRKISKELRLSEKAIGYHLTKSVKELKVHLRDFI
jgi:RNA polymerase sigma-70 factor (ECF subfamily)